MLNLRYCVVDLSLAMEGACNDSFGTTGSKSRVDEKNCPVAPKPLGSHACRYAYFAAIYILCGITGNVTSYCLDERVTVGASCAIFGLLGALAAYFLRNPRLERGPQQLLLLFGLVGLNVLLGLDEGGMIDNTGHISGLLAGLWLGWNTCPRWEVQHCLLVDLPRFNSA
jgi:membrane associated rhomboid family serine protease